MSDYFPNQGETLTLPSDWTFHQSAQFVNTKDITTRPALHVIHNILQNMAQSKLLDFSNIISIISGFATDQSIDPLLMFAVDQHLHAKSGGHVRLFYDELPLTGILLYANDDPGLLYLEKIPKSEITNPNVVEAWRYGHVEKPGSMVFYKTQRHYFSQNGNKVIVSEFKYLYTDLEHHENAESSRIEWEKRVRINNLGCKRKTTGAYTVRWKTDTELNRRVLWRYHSWKVEEFK